MKIRIIDLEKFVSDSIWRWAKDQECKEYIKELFVDNDDFSLFFRCLPDIIVGNLYCMQDENGIEIVGDNDEEDYSKSRQ